MNREINFEFDNKTNSLFSIQHSAFSIQHSAFSIHILIFNLSHGRI